MSPSPGIRVEIVGDTSASVVVLTVVAELLVVSGALVVEDNLPVIVAKNRVNYLHKKGGKSSKYIHSKKMH